MTPERFRLLRYLFAGCFAFSILFTAFVFKSFAKEPVTIRVLFIGNSLTSANDLPGMISRMARARNFLMEYDTHVPGGYTLSQHVEDPVLKDKINKGSWDFVVLQEQSQRPAFKGQQLEMEVSLYARKLSRMIRDSNPRAHVVFYMTMAKKNGDPMLATSIPEASTYEGMQERINAGYIHMAKQNHGLLVPVGFVWKNVRADRPAVNLYLDDTHPSDTGTYLAACAFYAVLFKDSPVGLPHSSQIDDKTAAYLQKMTERVIQGRRWDLE